jgi:hypothetical protein
MTAFLAFTLIAMLVVFGVDIRAKRHEESDRHRHVE